MHGCGSGSMEKILIRIRQIYRILRIRIRNTGDQACNLCISELQVRPDILFAVLRKFAIFYHLNNSMR